MPVIRSAARLNEAIRHCGSTVKTPSEMLSRIASVDVPAVYGIFLLTTFYIPDFRKLPINHTGNYHKIKVDCKEWQIILRWSIRLTWDVDGSCGSAKNVRRKR